MSEVDRLGLDGDMLIVVSVGGSRSFEMDAISKIEILSDPAISASPDAAAALLEAIHPSRNRPNPSRR